jgi:hypothetical protein
MVFQRVRRAVRLGSSTMLRSVAQNWAQLADLPEGGLGTVAGDRRARRAGFDRGRQGHRVPEQGNGRVGIPARSSLGLHPLRAADQEWLDRIVQRPAARPMPERAGIPHCGRRVRPARALAPGLQPGSSAQHVRRQRAGAIGPRMAIRGGENRVLPGFARGAQSSYWRFRTAGKTGINRSHQAESSTSDRPSSAGHVRLYICLQMNGGKSGSRQRLGHARLRRELPGAPGRSRLLRTSRRISPSRRFCPRRAHRASSGLRHQPVDPQAG